jgi:hypothetical protein
MTSKHWTLIAVTIFAAALCCYFNRDWFRKDGIQIYHRERPGGFARFRRKQPEASSTAPLMFGFDRRLKLTSVEVIPISDIETNKYPQPIWHLISDSNSVPTKGFVYGMNVPGMRPAMKGVDAGPLEPGVKYRLFVKAGSMNATHDFEIEPSTQPAQ